MSVFDSDQTFFDPMICERHGEDVRNCSGCDEEEADRYMSFAEVREGGISAVTIHTIPVAMVSDTVPVEGAALTQPTATRKTPARRSRKPSNIIEALAQVASELPPISKDALADEGYLYREIETILSAAHPLCAKYGIIWLPRVKEAEIVPVRGNYSDVRLHVVYKLCHGPSLTHDYAEVFAIGRNESDKGAFAAMTQAEKIMLVQVLQINDGRYDMDGVTVKGAPKEVEGLDVAAWEKFGYAVKADFDAMKRRVLMDFGKLDAGGKAAAMAWLKEHEQARKWPLPATLCGPFRTLLRELATNEVAQ